MPIDYVGGVMQGFAQGHEFARQNKARAAMGALMRDPTNQGALAALADADPEAAMQIQRQMHEQQAAQAKQLTEVFGRAARAAKTPQQWDAIAGWLSQNGIPGAANVVGKFSPEMRAGYMAQAGLDDDVGDPTSMQRNYEFLKGIDPKLAESYIQGQANPTQWIRTEDATGIHLTPVPRAGQPQPASNPPPAAIEHLKANPGLKAAFDEKYGAGSADRALGGAGSQAPGPFSPKGVSGETVTSTLRSPAHNKKVGGVANSYHLRGLARDSVPPRGMGMNAYFNALRALNPNLDVINEGDHVHMEPRGRF